MRTDEQPTSVATDDDPTADTDDNAATDQAATDQAATDQAATNNAATEEEVRHAVSEDTASRPAAQSKTTPPPARAFRDLPTAVTPVTATDIAAGVIAHARGRGRDEFVAEIVDYLDADSAATYSSYRRALGATLRELAANADPERTTVLLPAYCSSDFADAIHGVGLNVRRYDVDPETLAADLGSLESLRVDDVLAVVAVNVLGYASNMPALADFCTDADVFLVEALGYALGARYDGRRLGTFGDVSVVNFQQGKPIPVGGGMVVSRRPGLSFSDADRDPASPNVAALAGYAFASHPRPYYAYTRLVDELDRNSAGSYEPTTHPDSKTNVAYEDGFPTMSDFQGAVAGRIFDRLPETRRERAENAQYFADAFADCPHAYGIEPLDAIDDHQWVRYPLVVSSNELRGEIRRTLEAYGIQTPLLYNWPKLEGDRYPGARELQRRIVPLPTHPYVDDRDRETIVSIVDHVVEAYDDRI
jgi:dTDP-4-amino-4,6-dideoxygalactose transaminase